MGELTMDPHRFRADVSAAETNGDLRAGSHHAACHVVSEWPLGHGGNADDWPGGLGIHSLAFHGMSHIVR
jgi:hypothetical protein